MNKDITYSVATEKDAKNISEFYNLTFGENGFLSEDCDQWQEPFLFKKSGIEKFMREGGRVLLAKLENEVVGSLIHYININNFEESGASVHPKARGNGIYNKLIEFSHSLIQENEYTIVNEALLSSAAAINAVKKTKKLTGIGLCHYGRVKDPKIPESSTYFFEVNLANQRKEIFVPKCYKELVKAICRELKVSYEIKSNGALPQSEDVKFEADTNGIYPNAYIFVEKIGKDSANLIKKIDEIKKTKDYIEIQIPVNSADAISLISLLRKYDFFFQSFRPHQYSNESETRDLVCLQWVKRSNLGFYERLKDLFTEEFHKKIYNFIGEEIKGLN